MMQHPGGWQRCTEEPGIAMHAVHHCEQWTANRKRERYNMDIYLIRHGKTKGNLEGRYIGTTDEPLCEEGKQSLMQMADAKKVSGSGGTFCKSDAAVQGKCEDPVSKAVYFCGFRSAGMRFRQI